MKETNLKRASNFPIYPRDSITINNKGFLIIDDVSMAGTHWTCFYKKDKSVYFDSLGGQPDKFPLNQLRKPITFHNSKNQDINSRLCGTYYSYFCV